MQLDTDAILWSAPESERAGRPLLVLLHGLGSHEGDLVALAPQLPPEFVVAAVRAPLVEPPGWGWFPRSTDRPLAESVEPAGDAADAFLSWLRAARADAPTIGLLGFSQGAMVSMLALRRDPDAADFAVLLAGGAFPRPEAGDAALAERRPPVFAGYGLADDVVPRAMFEHTAAWLPSHADAEVRAYPGLAHAVSEEQLGDVVAFLRARL